MSSRGVDPRERILITAYALFTTYGLSAVGVDRVVAEAGVAKSTLYRHFPSKDHLAVAVLDRRDLIWTQGWLRPEVERLASTPAARLLAIFDALDIWFHRHDFEGCLFVNSLLETHGQSSPVRSATIAGMTRVRGVVLELAHEAGADDPEGLARALYMLITGSIIGAEQGDLDSAREAKEVAGLVRERAGVASSRDAPP